MNKIITVSREFGSGGRELGKRLAETLGIAFYDKEIISEIANKTALADEYVNQVVERRIVTYYPITTSRSLYSTVDPQNDINNAIYAEQSNILREMAQKSDCVIVGRCSDYILRDYDPYRIFVYADMESKLARCRQRAPGDEHLTDRELQRKIKAVDKSRAKYYQFFTGRNWADRLNYDLCINTSGREIKPIVNAIAKIV